MKKLFIIFITFCLFNVPLAFVTEITTNQSDCCKETHYYGLIGVDDAGLWILKCDRCGNIKHVKWWWNLKSIY